MFLIFSNRNSRCIMQWLMLPFQFRCAQGHATTIKAATTTTTVKIVPVIPVRFTNSNPPARESHRHRNLCLQAALLSP